MNFDWNYGNTEILFVDVKFWTWPSCYWQEHTTFRIMKKILRNMLRKQEAWEEDCSCFYHSYRTLLTLQLWRHNTYVDSLVWSDEFGKSKISRGFVPVLRYMYYGCTWMCMSYKTCSGNYSKYDPTDDGDFANPWAKPILGCSIKNRVPLFIM